MAAPVRSSYPHVDKALRRFEAYIQQLPVVSSLPASPNAAAPMNVHEFAEVARAMRDLPACKAPQLVNSQLQQEIADLQDRYATVLNECVEKGLISTSSLEALLRTVLPNMNKLEKNNQVGRSGQGIMANANKATASQVNTSTSNGFFAFGKNTPEAVSERRKTGIFSTVRRLVAPAA